MAGSSNRDDGPSIDELDPFGRERATKLAPGVTLFTKDGSRVGNGIIVQERQLDYLQKIGGMAEYLAETNQKLWLVETDFGNRMNLVDREIEEYYELGFQQDHATWFADRWKTIQEHQGNSA